VVTASDRGAYVRALSSFGELTRADVEEGLAIAQPLSYAPRTWLLRAGERATRASIVVHGLVRELFVLSDGTERTKAFVHEGGITGSLADLLSGGPSRGCIVAEEPTRVLSFEYGDFLALASRRPRWEAIRTTSRPGSLKTGPPSAVKPTKTTRCPSFFPFSLPCNKRRLTEQATGTPRSIQL